VIVTSLDPVRVADEDVWVEDGRVAERRHGTRIESSGLLVVPGNVCAHTHLYSALARAMPYTLAPPRSFLQILQRVWWRLDRALDEESIRASALVGGMEALLCGTTTIVDHHASPNAVDGSLDVIAEALGSFGARSVLCYETSDRDGPERARAGLDENRRFLAASRGQSLVRGLVGAHASFTLGEETLSACAELAREFDTGVHVHAAEDVVDERDARTRSGRRVVERLVEHGVVDEHGLLAHGVQFDDHEISVVQSLNATVVHNARSNMSNGVGHARVWAFGDRLALGTDGIGSDMFEESRAAHFRLREDDLRTTAGWPLARLAESARLAGRIFDEPLLGTLEPGAPADLVVLDYPAPARVDDGSFAGHWIYGLSSRLVRDVMVGGEWVVRGRRLVRADVEEIARQARAQSERLWRRLEQIEPHPFEPLGGSV
jgi:putative selenium metabolism protein SsnA